MKSVKYHGRLCESYFGGRRVLHWKIQFLHGVCGEWRRRSWGKPLHTLCHSQLPQYIHFSTTNICFSHSTVFWSKINLYSSQTDISTRYGRPGSTTSIFKVYKRWERRSKNLPLLKMASQWLETGAYIEGLVGELRWWNCENIEVKFGWEVLRHLLLAQTNISPGVRRPEGAGLRPGGGA